MNLPDCDCGTCCEACGHYPDCIGVIFEAWDSETITTADVPWLEGAE